MTVPPLDKLRAAFLFANTQNTSGRLFYVRDPETLDIGFLQITQGGRWVGQNMEVGIYEHRFVWFKLSESQYPAMFPPHRPNWVGGDWYKERQISNNQVT